MIEILTVLALAVVISLVILSNLLNSRSRFNLDNTTRQIAAILREAQSRSVAQQNGAVWGVHFDNVSTTPFYALFQNSYSSSSEFGYYRLPSGTVYSTSSIAKGAIKEITFSQISGLPSASTSVTISLMAASISMSSSTIFISSSGLVSF